MGAANSSNPANRPTTRSSDRMAFSREVICSVKKTSCVACDKGTRSNPEWVTIRASQFPVAMQLIKVCRRSFSKSSLVATEILAAGYRVSSSDETAPACDSARRTAAFGRARAASVPSPLPPSCRFFRLFRARHNWKEFTLGYEWLCHRC